MIRGFWINQSPLIKKDTIKQKSFPPQKINLGILIEGRFFSISCSKLKEGCVFVKGISLTKL